MTYCSFEKIAEIQYLANLAHSAAVYRFRFESNMLKYVSFILIRWYGHEARMPDCRLPRFLLDWKPNYGKRSRGRPRKNWKACVLEDAANFTGVENIDIDTVQALAADRVQWRYMIRRQRDVCDAGHSND